MEKSKKNSNSVCYAQSSEPFRIYNDSHPPQNVRMVVYYSYYELKVQNEMAVIMKFNGRPSPCSEVIRLCHRHVYSLRLPHSVCSEVFLDKAYHFYITALSFLGHCCR
jgi:hypothetical protein